MVWRSGVLLEDKKSMYSFQEYKNKITCFPYLNRIKEPKREVS